MTDEAREIIWKALAEDYYRDESDPAACFKTAAILAALTAAGLVLLRWRRVTPTEPEDGKTVLVQHEEDLFPVPAYRLSASRLDPEKWHYEQDGPEDEIAPGDHKHTPLRRAPTHYAELPFGWPAGYLPPVSPEQTKAPKLETEGAST